MFDPADPAFLANPYPQLNAMRESAPVLYHETLGRWFITRHNDVRNCLRDRRLGRNFRHMGTEEEFHAQPLDPRWSAFWDVERWSLLSIEPPEHTRIRKLVAAAFTPRSVESLRAQSLQLARNLLAPLIEKGHFEVLSEFAQPFSIGIISRMLGVPEGRERDLLDWSHRMVKMYEFNVSDAHASAANQAAADFRSYVLALLDDRRRQPQEDMITRLAHAEVEGEALSDAEIISTIVVLLNAGHEATVNTLGNGMLAFRNHPHEWEKLRAGEASASNAIEECIRWDPPLQLFERWVLEDGVEIAGVAIPRGEKLAMLFGAANRDPRQFADADRFDVARENAADHIGFGGGTHACIGAPLARIELEATMTALMEQLSHLELSEEPERTGAFVIWGLKSLHLTLRQ